jgi:type VI secretion system secreted protein VgrG
MTDPIPTVDYAFDVQGGPNPDWKVRRFHLTEGISQPYELVVDLLTEDTGVDPQALLGASARLDIERGDLVRHVAGVVHRVDYVGVNVDRKLALRLYVVPALRLLGQVVGSRIFQDQTVPEILETVLAEGLAPFEREADLSGLSTSPDEYPKRDYCVQYRETVLDFVSRLMEEDGIAYAFRVEGDKEVLVLVDQSSGDPNSAYPEAEVIDPDGSGMVPIITDRPDLADRDSLRYFDFIQPLRPNQVVVRSFNWKAFAPAEEPLETAVPAEPPTPARRIYVDSPARKIVDEQAGADPKSSFDGTAIDEPKLEAQRRFELYGSQTQLGRGRSNCTGFQAGTRFTIDDRSFTLVEPLPLLITHLSHHGEAPGVETSDAADGARYENAFECIPVGNAYRPPRTTPPPRIHGPQTATVTGTDGEEIHTDVHGRIKVRFHWDEHHPLDDTASCWVRVAQMWAGPGWGTWWLPRVGMEVVVEFLDGNPDRPLVTGCVYNSANPPPYPLPDEKTKSTIKSNSSKGGDGFNEFRFEDAKGSEQVFLHAQKDLSEVILNDMSTSVGHDQSLSVGNDRSKSIKGYETITVNKDRMTTIDGSETIHIKGSLDMKVDGGSNAGKAADPAALGVGMSVTGEYNIKASSKFTVTVGASKLVMDTSTIALMTSSQMTLTVGGSSITLVPGQITVASGTVVAAGGKDGASTLTLDANADLKGGGHVLVHKGGSKLKLDGTAGLHGSTTKITGDDLAHVSAAAAKLTGDAVTVGGGKVDIAGDAAVNVVGGVIKLN